MTCYEPLIPITCPKHAHHGPKNMFRYHNVKANGPNGRLREKMAAILSLLPAFTILG
jgi:hypothetical protein